MDKPTIIGMINNDEDVQIIFYENNSKINDLIYFAVDNIFEKYNQSDLKYVIYGCIKELVINATKANLKRAFFQKNGIDINNIGQYVSNLARFRRMIDKTQYSQYFDDLRDMDLWVMLGISHCNDGVKLEVINNCKIIEVEETRIRMKLRVAMVYNSIAEFYEREHDDSEGAGMGIAIIISLLQSANIDPKLFRIWSTDETTVSRIEVPFTDNYVSNRNNN